MAQVSDQNGLDAFDIFQEGDGFPVLGLTPEEAAEVRDHLAVQLGKWAIIDNPESSAHDKAKAQEDLLELIEQHPEINDLAFLARRLAAARRERQLTS